MLLVECRGCGSRAFLECACPPVVTGTGYHLAGCNHLSIDANVVCAPDSEHPDCCHIDHDHAAEANACPGDHGECTLEKCSALTPTGEPCPGGHCAKGIEGCTGCRPLTITVMPGSVALTHSLSGS